MFTLTQAQAMAAATPGPSACFDEGGACTFVNTAWIRLTGFDAELACGRGWTSAIYEEDQGPLSVAWRQFVEDGLASGPSGIFTIELRLIPLATKQVRWVRMQVGRLVGREGRLVGYLGQFVDVHDLHEAQSALRERAQLLEMSDALMHVGHWHLHSSSGDIYWSDELHRMHGTDAHHFQPRLEDAVAAYHSDDQASVAKVVGGVTKDGRPYTVDARLVGDDGKVRYVRMASVPWRSENDGPDVIGVCQDVTEQMEALQALESRTLDLQRSNAELARFAAVASHDLKEPLRRIRTFCDLIEEDEQNVRESVTNYLPRIKSSAERLHRMVGELLELARVSEVAKSRQSVDIGRVVQRVYESFSDVFRGEASFLAENLPTLRANETQMEQVFSNLIGNSIKYASTERPLRVKVYGQPSQDRNWIQICVEDNGIGFEPEQGDRIFELFERLHARDAYPGTGLGLALCKRVIEEHGGRIGARALFNVGATFSVELPDTSASATGERHGKSTSDLHLRG